MATEASLTREQRRATRQGCLSFHLISGRRLRVLHRPYRRSRRLCRLCRGGLRLDRASDCAAVRSAWTRRVNLFQMKTYTAVVERSPETGLFVGFIPGFPGAHTQAESLDELNANLREVLGMLLEDGEPQIEAEFVGTQLVRVG